MFAKIPTEQTVQLCDCTALNLADVSHLKRVARIGRNSVMGLINVIASVMCVVTIIFPVP